MLRSCKYCGRIHDTKFDCGMKPRRVKRQTEQSALRNTARWRRARMRVNDRDGCLCRVCLSQGVITHDGLETHHIIPLAENPDYAFDGDWLITLCGRHHELAERGEITRDVLHKLALSPLGDTAPMLKCAKPRSPANE